MFVSHKYRAIFVHIQRTGGNSIQRIFEEHDPDLVQTIPIDPARNRTKHCYAADIEEALDPAIFRAYTKFCVVRNPFDRMVSWYAHFKDDANPEDAAITVDRGSRLMRAYERGLAALAGRPSLLRAYRWAWTRALGALRTSSPEEVALRFEAIGARVKREVNRLAADFDEFVRLPRDHAGGLFERLYVNQIEYASRGDTLLVDRILRFEDLAADFAALAEPLGFPGRLPHRNASRSRTADYREWYSPQARDEIARRFARDCERFGYAF